MILENFIGLIKSNFIYDKFIGIWGVRLGWFKDNVGGGLLVEE